MSYVKNDSQYHKNTARGFTRNEITQFKERLRQAMKGESGNSLAKRSGISEAAIRTYLSGKTYPSLDKLAVLAEKCEVSIEWLANGVNTTTLVDTKEPPEHVTEVQEKVWLEFLHRMTPKERDAIIESVVRKGLSALLQSAHTNNKQEQSIDDLSAEDMLIARMYASLTPEDKKSFLESVNKDERSNTNRNMSDKTKAS
ncbi:helix-turn-helix transcriptional regulator [Providencia rettgeri]|uniref:helix-turn-helix domain-containing protein n=1 Tax=Providencia rettgeri TaxID=587 RepID=UPI00301ACABE